MDTPRYLVVDDTDSRIHYSEGDWFQDNGGQDNLGFAGPTYKHTLHGTNGYGSLSFTFEGSYLALYGTTQFTKDSVPKGECFVDKKSIGETLPAFPPSQNNWILCNADGLSNGPHTFELKVTTPGTTFWVDRFLVPPSPEASYDDQILLVDNADLGVQFESGWEQYRGSMANVTSVKGSSVKFNFIGSSLAWFGVMPISMSDLTASGSFSIDGGPATSFQLNGVPTGSAGHRYNVPLFKTPELAPVSHSIVVTYNGGGGSAAPLSLDYLYVTSPKFSTPPADAAPAGPPTSSLDDAPPSSTSNALGTSASSAPFTGIGPNVSDTVAPHTAIGTHTPSTSTLGSNNTSLPGIGTNSLSATHGTSPTSVGPDTPGGVSLRRLGPIIGGAVAGLLLVALVIIIVIWRRRRIANNKTVQGSTSLGVTPFVLFPPFRITPIVKSDLHNQPIPSDSDVHIHSTSVDPQSRSRNASIAAVQPRAAHKNRAPVEPEIRPVQHRDRGIRSPVSPENVIVEDMPPRYSAA